MARRSHARWRMLTAIFLGASRGAVSITCPIAAQSLNVTTTEKARDLATVVNCSGGGIFDVFWEGTVIVETTIALTDGSTVSITGVGIDAIVDGGGTTQLFTVYNSFLSITNVGFENGYGTKNVWDDYSSSGGAVAAAGIEAVVSFHGNITFNYNTASNGGAVSVLDGARASWTGDTSFKGNNATVVYGGAVQAVNGASLSWSGNTIFNKNSASVGGGALYSNAGVVSWRGETYFVGNSASYYGGTILARCSDISWSGVTSFENSKLLAGLESGGTVQVEDSVLSWQGDTTFNGGYGGTGGALHVAGSNVSWRGETSFLDNVGEISGGAMHTVRSSSVSWTGQTRFFNNRVYFARGIVVGSGGAIFVADSRISWNGTTIFTNNSVDSDGGAVYAGGSTSMVWSGRTTFSKNTANTNGGAIALVGITSVDLGPVGNVLLLSGNVATILGGAVYQANVNNGLIWTGASFISNSALNGGAVYSVGNAPVVDEGKGMFPTTYDNCTFEGNWASASGGAMESTSGTDKFVNTVFKDNTAVRIGGALKVAGTTNISSCDFVGNGAEDAGPAVSNVGTLSVFDTAFSNNGLLCAPGTFLNYTVEGNPTQDSEAYYYSVCEGCDICSGRCLVDGNGTQQCIVALDNTESTGVDSDGVSITLEKLNISSRYWRATPSTATIRPCWNEDACRGGITGNAAYCAEGYKGPYCAICKDDYAPTLAYTCSKCSSGEGIAFTVVVLLAALVALFAATFHLASNTSDTTKTRLRHLLHTLPLQGLKTVVVAWQILTQFDAVANVTYAGVYGQFLDGISSLVSLDLGLVLSAGCMAKTDFHDRLFFFTLGPLIALGLLGVSFRVAAQRSRASQDDLQAARRKHFSMVLLMTFLIYSSVSSIVFRVFDCETLEDDKQYLRADYSIECTTAKHKALKVYAGLMILLYPIGIPVFYGTILFNNREILQRRRHQSEKLSADLEMTADLWKQYKPGRYYYEVVECARRVTLTGVVVFIYPNTAAQVAVTLVLAFVFVMVSESLAPYASSKDAWMSRVAHVVVFMSMFQGLVLKADVSNESTDSQEVFGGVLLAANVCMVAAVITEAVMGICSLFRGNGTDLDETVKPGDRNTTSTRNVVESWDMIEREEAPTTLNESKVS